MSGLLRPCRIEGRGRTRYRTEVRHARLEHVGLTAVRLGGPARVRVSAEKDISLVQVPMRGAFATDYGGGRVEQFAQGRAAQIVGADAPIQLDFQPGTRMLIIDLRPPQLEVMGGAARFFRLARRSPVLPLNNKRAAQLLRLLEFLLTEIEMSDDLPSSPVAARMEQMLIAVIGALLDDDAETPASAALLPALGRAEAFMAAHLDADLSPDQIAAAAGISTRSLHRLFRIHRATTPVLTLKQMRLDRVRADIMAGRVGPDGLTGLAMRCGINHMGLFAADFRNRFGCLPSRMLADYRAGAACNDTGHIL